MEASTPGPVFEDYEPTAGCGCAGCADGRRLRLLPVRDGGLPAAHGGARRALVAATAASMVLGAGTVAAAAPIPAPDGPGANRAADPGPPTEQGGTSGLHGAPSHASPDPEKPRPTTRTEIINRAKAWVAAAVPYDMEAYWKDGYRQDCSGYVSMAWDLGTNEWTGSLAKFGVRVTKDELQPGDILLFHNPADPNKGSHVVIFGGWTDSTHTYYTAYEQTPPGTRTQATPYAYWKNSASYLPYRYKGLTAGSAGTVPVVADRDNDAGAGSTAFPGADKFGPGADNSYVTRLGQMLVRRGGGRFYTQGPGPRWGTADLNATRAFQQAQGWTGADADGIPGARTWALLVQGAGKNIPPVAAGAVPVAAAAVPAVASTGGAETARPAYPGLGVFRTGQSSPYVTRLGRQLVLKGFGTYYTSAPGPSWGEADRRNVEAFQRAQGWRGAEADGYPGPETWRRLFA
ncbi:peptidoglycan-binding protein [Streptomyces sp. NPDC048361]|uniref:peptidoglycan-binding protein n=1 Tax=Streptomyces sp. NPDC048361 TaxID=3154720 RepID=UPI00341784DB